MWFNQIWKISQGKHIWYTTPYNTKGCDSMFVLKIMTTDAYSVLHVHIHISFNNTVSSWKFYMVLASDSAVGGKRS